MFNSRWIRYNRSITMSETNEKGASSNFLSLILLSFCLSTSPVKMKEELGYSEKSHWWLWKHRSPLLAWIQNVHQNAVFKMGKNRWRARVTDNHCKRMITAPGLLAFLQASFFLFFFFNFTQSGPFLFQQ